MPDGTQMENIFKGFPTIMNSHQLQLNSKNLDMVKDNFKSFEDRASIDNTLLSIYDKFYSNWPKYLRLAPITLFLTGVTQSLELDQKKT